jgi:DNA-binding transcriptional LysR family regulator
VSLSFSSLALTRPIDELRHAFPRVVPHVTTGWSLALTEHVRDGALDVAFTAHLEGKQTVTHLSTVPLGTHPMVLIAPTSAHVPKLAEPETLRDATWVLNPEGCSFRQELEHVLHQAGVKLRVAVAIYGWDLQLSLVARGLGFGLFPAWVLRGHRLRPKVRMFRLRGFEASVEFVSVHGRNLGRLEEAAKVLDEALMTQIRAAVR